MASRRRHGDGNEGRGVKARPARDREHRLVLEDPEAEPPRPRRRRNARATATPARREIRTLH
ncbi:MAG TPA: hypothetical protein VD970_10420 [Acetobacteraceae bacterium]|nr:hypothetical protein [Acetobacteraceae bacterium]